MNADEEYVRVLEHLYEKSLVLHDTSLWDPVLQFFFLDALAHLDYTLGILSYTYQSPKNIMAQEYMRWRIDEEKKGNRQHFPAFMSWLAKNHPDRYTRLPTLWQRIYDPDDPASYRSFRIVLDPDSQQVIKPHVFFRMIDEFFDREFLKSLYSEDGSLSRLFAEFMKERRSIAVPGN
ncbi:MAG: hypothetical protein QHG97_02980 [Methanolinea sp.]|jgi:hypothetical protein|nr:hypothetical protein [Methanolinea sp.]